MRKVQYRRFMMMNQNEIYQYPFIHAVNTAHEITATYFTDPWLQPYKVFRPHCSDHYTIQLFTSGYGEHYIDFNTLEVKRGYMLFIDRKQIQNFDPKETFDGKSLIFTHDFFCQSNLDRQFLAKTQLFNNLMQIVYFDAGPRFEELVRLFEQISEELKRPFHEYQAALLHSYLSSIIFIAEILYRPSGTYVPSKKHLLIAEFKRMVNLNLHRRLTIGQYAKKLNTNIRSLQAAFEEIEGSSPKTYVIDRTILEIKRKLTFELLTVNEIAVELGFKEATNLTKFFKVNTGSTPLKFRQSFA